MANKSFNLSPGDMDRIIGALDVGVFVADHQGLIVGINECFEKVTTIKREEIVGRDVDFLLTEGFISTSVWKRVMQQRKPATCIINYKGKTDHDVIVTGKPIFDATGQIVFVVCTLRDWNELGEVYKELNAAQQQTEEYRHRLQNMTLRQAEPPEFIARDRRTKAMLQMAIRVAKVDAPVLLLGETGVGKDLLAKIIHNSGARGHKGSFVHVNCGAIPETLFESELFGYIAGAFTGASKTGKPGLFEIADNGTLFLDEIAELPMLLQAKLLKALQEKTIVRVGDTKERPVDVKIIAATNKNLAGMVAGGTFRHDLYYRLNVFPLTIPSLRDRKDDIAPLSEFFLKKFNRKYGQNKTMSPEVCEALESYHWPGNVRELEHLLERTMVLCPDDVIRTEHLPREFSDNIIAGEAVRLSDSVPLKAIVEKIEKAVILEAIKKTATLEAAAKQLGIDLSTLTRKKQRYGVSKKRVTMHMSDAN